MHFFQVVLEKAQEGWFGSIQKHSPKGNLAADKGG
jgi:hypothetical protein